MSRLLPSLRTIRVAVCLFSTAAGLRAAVPAISSVSPSSGPTTGGTTVVLTGTSFTGASAVAFGGNAATSFTVDSATQITAVSPAASSGTINVRVTAADGTSATAPNNQYTYQAGPQVQSVAVPANGSYKAGTNLDFTVTWDQPTSITGTPRLALTIGAATVQADYVSSPTSTTALFRCTVLAGQNDTDGITIGALTLNGGTIRNATGTDATLALNSVASTSSVLVDTTAPTVSSITRNNPATIHTSELLLTWRVTFSEAVAGVDASDFQLTKLSGNPNYAIASVTPAGPGIYDVAVDVHAGPLSGLGQVRLDLKASGTGITDTAANALSGGFTSGDFYQFGVTDVFDTLALATGTVRSVASSTGSRVAQRFTTAAGQPLTITTVIAALGTVSGTPVPSVTIHADNAGAPGEAFSGFVGPSSLTSNTLATWTGSVSLQPSTTYWIVFELLLAGGSYEIKETAATAGGAGAWLNSPADYLYKYGPVLATGPQAGALQMAIGAGSTPAISSPLTANGTYGSPFSYVIRGTNFPSSYEATGLPRGLELQPVTGVITGTFVNTGTFNVVLTATNATGTGAPSTLVLTVGKAEVTITADDKTKAYNTINPTLTVSYDGLANGDGAGPRQTPETGVLTTTPTLATSATTNSDVGSYPITFASGATSPNYTFRYVPGTLTVTKAPQTITFAAPPVIRLGAATALSATASSGLPVTFSIVSGPATVAGASLTATGLGQVTVRASQAGSGNFNAATSVEYTLPVNHSPMPTASGQGPVMAGSSVTLTQSAIIPNSTIQWQRDGTPLVGGTGPSILLTNLQPSSSGLYSSTSTLAGGVTSTSNPAIVGVSTDQKVIGTGSEVGANIMHRNGNTYDQVLLQGSGASLTADKGQVTRISFIDLSNDIVQVEFSGAGTLSLVMDNASAPAPAEKYNQPGVDYVRGQAGLVITGADETSNLNIFSVGKTTAVNQSLFRDDVNYDGVADLGYVAIQSTNGRFGSLFAGNAYFFGTTGFTGVYAPGVQFTGVVNIGNLQAFDRATPVLIFGYAGTVNITGGGMKQWNNEPVQVSGITQLKFVDGSTSAGTILKAHPNQAVVLENGIDVTNRIVVSPPPQ